jgi:hypothetical protein
MIRVPDSTRKWRALKWLIIRGEPSQASCISNSIFIQVLIIAFSEMVQNEADKPDRDQQRGRQAMMQQSSQYHRIPFGFARIA